MPYGKHVLLSTGGNSSVTAQLVSRQGNLHFSIQESFTATTEYFPLSSLSAPCHYVLHILCAYVKTLSMILYAIQISQSWKDHFNLGQSDNKAEI